MIKKITVFLIMLSGLLTISGCASLNKSCLLGGCYGPFEIVLKAEHGEHVEDVIVRLAYTEATSHGGSNIYKEYAIGNTGEAIHLPRGFFARNGVGTLDGVVYHPDYQTVFRPNISKQLGVTNLGTVIIKSNRDLHSDSIAIEAENMRKKGLSEAEINKKLKEKRTRSPGNRLNPKYFAILLDLNRKDVVKKYLPEYLKDYYEYKKFSKKQASAFEDKMMKNIDRHRR